MIKISFLIISLVLISCNSSEPSVEHNWHYQEVKADTQMWKHRFDQAINSIIIEESRLYSSQDRHIVRFRNSIDHLKDAEPFVQVYRVNAIVNKDVVYKHDYDHYGKSDVWGFPIETLEEGGDCEDFAFLKLIALLHLGWDEEKLKIIVGEHIGNKDKKEFHAVLLVTLPNGADVLLSNTHRLTLPPDLDDDFIPLYSIKKSGYYKMVLTDQN